jgi:chromate reductase
MIGAAATRFDADGRLTDEATRKFIATMLIALRDWTLRLRGGS